MSADDHGHATTDTKTNPLIGAIKKHPILSGAVVLVILLAIYWSNTTPQAFNGNAQQINTVGPSPAVKQQAAELEGQIVNPTAEPVGIVSAPRHLERPAKPVRSTCDDGWKWDGSVCVREARPSAEQYDASIIRMKCVPGSTRIVDRELVVNGHKVHRKVTQTCETLASVSDNQ